MLNVMFYHNYLVSAIRAMELLHINCTLVSFEKTALF